MVLVVGAPVGIDGAPVRSLAVVIQTVLRLVIVDVERGEVGVDGGRCSSGRHHRALQNCLHPNRPLDVVYAANCLLTLGVSPLAPFSETIGDNFSSVVAMPVTAPGAAGGAPVHSNNYYLLSGRVVG